jgi:hypothetical protein
MSAYVAVPGLQLQPGDILMKKMFKTDPISHRIQTGQAIVKGTKNAN